MAQCAVVHIHHALPHHRARIDAYRVGFALDIIIDDRCQEVISLLNSGKVTRKVQVDILHRHHLRIATTSSPSFDTKNRS